MSLVSASMAVRKLERAAQADFLLEEVATTSTSSAPASCAIWPRRIIFWSSSSSSDPTKVTRMEAPTSSFFTRSGKMGLPVKAAEEVTISASMNSMDWGSRLASLIFGTKRIQDSTSRKGTRQDTSQMGSG